VVTPRSRRPASRYRTALRRYGIGDLTRILPGGLTEEAGAAAARTLVREPCLPSAVIVFNDRCATGVLDVLLRAGFDIPGDVSVVGYDDGRLARLSYVALTTVAQDAPLLARLATTRAIEQLDGRPVEEQALVIPPHLVVRATTGPPRPDAVSG
jgi:DNA-binding LacI/PurR family transcriptional regulator